MLIAPPLKPLPGWRWIVSLFVAAVCVVVLAWMISVQVEPAIDIRSDLVKVLFTLSTGLLISGAVAILLKYREALALREGQEHLLRWQLINSLREVHRQVKLTQLLVAAHKSALTYGVQIRESIVPAIATIADVQLILRQCLPFQRSDLILCELKHVRTYLDALVEEFRDKYEGLSATQLLSEDWNKKEIGGIADRLRESHREPTHGKVSRSTAPWKMLIGEFPNMLALIQDVTHGPHQVGFSQPLNAAITQMLQEATTIASSQVGAGSGKQSAHSELDPVPALRSGVEQPTPGGTSEEVSN